MKTSKKHRSATSMSKAAVTSAAGLTLSPMRLPLYLPRPLEKIDSISTEAVLSCIQGIYSGNNETRSQAKKLFDLFFAGLLIRGGSQNLPADVIQQLSNFILSKIPDPNSSGKPPPDQMLSTLFLRGFFVIDDPNVWQSAKPLKTSDGAAILAILWSRITRHEYANFRDQSDGQVNGTTLSSATGFKGLDDFVADGAEVIVDFEAIDVDVSHGERWGILGTWTSGKVTLQSSALPQSLHICVHAVAKFQSSGGALTLDPPIALKADPRGMIMAIDLLSDSQVGTNVPGTSNISPLNPKGFAFIQDGDVVNGKLTRLSALVWPSGVTPPLKDRTWIRLAVCNSKTVNVRPYVTGPNPPQANSLIFLEQDQEDDICVSARIVVSGAAPDKISLGPPSLCVRRVPSSVLPVMPVIKAVEPGPWNIRLQWATTTLPSGTNIYDDSNWFHVGLECTPISAAPVQVAEQGRSLKEILAGMPSGSWPRDDNEWSKVGDWLAGPKRKAKFVAELPTFQDDPKVFQFAKAGSVLIAPTKANKPDGCLQWSGADDIDHWRRENYVWRMRLRSIENHDFPDFEMVSDWTAPTEPIAALPLIPVFGEQVATPAEFPRPAVEINVDYKTQYRTSADTTLGYRLVVRKALVVPTAETAEAEPETAMFSERVIEASAPDWKANPPYLWRFRFLDQNVAPPDTLDKQREYHYELELQQLNRVGTSTVVVTKSNSLRVICVANQSINVQANEPLYE